MSNSSNCDYWLSIFSLQHNQKAIEYVYYPTIIFSRRTVLTFLWVQLHPFPDDIWEVYNFIPMQLRFKIKSYSSQSNNHPAANLLSKHAPWESERFCDYPQIITIAFYQPTLINTIKIASHPTKIPSRINILYHQAEHDEQTFTKYGFFTFLQHAQPNNAIVEVKQHCNVEIKALEIRLLLLQNHATKQNFFNQVGLSSLAFTGTPLEQKLIPMALSNHKSATGFFEPQISLLTQLKNRFIKKEAFDEVKQIKQILNFIIQANQKMCQLQTSKQSFIKEEDYMGAKRVKAEMVGYKLKVTDVVDHFYDPEQNQIKTIKSDAALKQKIEQLGYLGNNSEMLQASQAKSSRLKEDLGLLKQEEEAVSEEEEERKEENRDESVINYEDRILPAVMSRIKGSAHPQLPLQSSEIGDNQFYQNKDKDNTLPAEPEILSPADEANSSYLLEFYDNLFIRKIHSRYWQFRLQAITQAINELKGGISAINKNKLRCYLFIYALSLKSHNYQTSNAALELMNLLAPMRAEGEYKNQLHNELENVIKITLKKMNDSNQKIKNQAEKTLLRVIESSLFGVGICYSSIVKSYHQKTSAKLRKTKLQNIDYMVQKYGVGDNKVPFTVADFAIKAANDQDAEVRKSAIDLIKSVKMRGGNDKLDNMLIESKVVKKSLAKLL